MRRGVFTDSSSHLLTKEVFRWDMMDKQKEILQYVEELNAWTHEEMFETLKQYATQHHVPIMEDIGIDFLCQLARVKSPRVIIEVGTAIGFSAIRLAYACPEAMIYTFERNEARIQEAKKNIAAFQLSDRIHIIEGDALETFSELPLDLHADFLFIDAAKGKSRQFLENFEPFLSDEPLVVIDNVLFKGYVVSDEGLTRRKKQLVRKIRDFHQWMMAHPAYHTVIVPIGDGIALCIPKKEQE